MRATWRWSTRERGPRHWDLFLRATGVVALLGIPITLLWNDAVPLVWFGLLTVPANSVVAPLVPASFELLILETSKYASIAGITLVGTAVFVLMEYLNWHIYAWALTHARLERLRQDRRVRSTLRYFERAPFLTVTLFPFTLLPFWAVRSLAVLNGYSLRRFLAATALGRAPRIAAYAWLGAAFNVPTRLLLMAVVALSLVAIAIKVAQRRGRAHQTPAQTPVTDDEQASAGPPPQPFATPAPSG
ncbi:MAG: hypothetical protein IPL40_00880 [Proteobacteria bacterium]|nr:hypothetical protein [Pseudomonadota bacterium]